MNLEQVRAELRTVLSQMGQDPDEIANTLHNEGTTGVPKTGCDCPAAHHVGQKLGHYGQVWVTSYSTEILVPNEQGALTSVEVVNPAPVHEFIRRLDQGDYPHLVEGHD